MAVNSLTPNMPRFDTLQKSQHSMAYRACQLLRGHCQIRSQLCSEHPLAWAPLYIILEIQISGREQLQQSRPSPGACSRLVIVHSHEAASLIYTHVALASPSLHDQTTPAGQGSKGASCMHTCFSILPCVLL